MQVKLYQADLRYRDTNNILQQEYKIISSRSLKDATTTAKNIAKQAGWIYHSISKIG